MNEINIEYKIKEDDIKIKIFDEDFIKNNKDNCKIIIDEKEHEICSELEIKENMKNKKSIKIKLKEIKPITNLFAMFAECTSLISLPDICNFDMTNITNLRSIFFKCSSLSSLSDISKWNTKNVKNMKGIFNGCSSLVSLPDISKWNTENVTVLIALFADCSSLKSLPDISK